MSLLHVAIELTLRYLANTEGEKKSRLAGDLLFREKTKREKREGRREKGEVLAVVLSQYVATIAEQDERRRWS